MKTAIFGAGAIGCYVAAMLGKAGHDPTLIARGDTLKAIQDKGLTLTQHNAGDTPVVSTIPIRAVEKAEEVGVQDVVFLTTKGHQIKSALAALTPLIGPDTVIVPALNGIPWWYLKGFDHPMGGQDLQSSDPTGAIGQTIDVSQVVGCVVYLASFCPEPGAVTAVGPKTVVLGAPVSRRDDRVADIAAMLTSAGFEAPVTNDIRKAVWVKLWGNIHANPISVITLGTMEQILGDPQVAAVSARIMAEAADVAKEYGVTFDVTIEQRLEDGRKLGSFRTSMLQDFDRGRAIELDGILGSVAELGRKSGVDTPAIDMLYALVRMRARLAGAYDDPV